MTNASNFLFSQRNFSANIPIVVKPQPMAKSDNLSVALLQGMTSLDPDFSAVSNCSGFCGVDFTTYRVRILVDDPIIPPQ